MRTRKGMCNELKYTLECIGATVARKIYKKVGFAPFNVKENIQ